ncbi:MAG: hypothetical protein IJC90_03390 [Clostridia bacterium]|nr:hypothetical protein [Clostridia bacterium]
MIYNKPRDFVFKAPTPEKQPKHKKQNHKSSKTKTEVIVIKQKPKREEVIKIASFFITLYLGTVLAFIIPLRPTYSETEKRSLQEFPEFTFESLYKGDYFDNITLWFSDTFPLREGMTKINTALKSLSGFSSVKIHGDVEGGDDIPDVPLDVVVTVTEESTTITTTAPTTTEEPTVTSPNVVETTNDIKQTIPVDMNIQSLGAVLLAGNSAYEYYNFSNSLAPRYINAVNNIKNASGNKSNVYTLVVPTSIDIELNDAIRKDINSSDQKKALEYFNSSFKNTTAVTGIYENLRNHRTEYLYFRTDHHWTALGAYYAYEQFIYTKGVDPVSLNKYNVLSFDGFLGSFYASTEQSPALAKTPDTVIAYEPFNKVSFKITPKDGATFDWDVVADASEYAPNMKYTAFIGADQPYSIIENLDNPDGETCLVIKDSFGNAFIPFLIPHYKTIHIIDPRYYDVTLSEFSGKKQIDDIIFISNISTTRNEVFIGAMEKFIK